MLVELLETTDWPPVAGALVLTLGVAYLTARLVQRLAHLALMAALGDEATPADAPAIVRPVRLIGGAVFVLVAAALAFPALALAGVPIGVGIAPTVMLAWAFESGLRIVLIVVLAYALMRIIAVVIRRFEFELSRGVELDALERAKRARTLGNLGHNALAVLVLGVAVLMILRELRLDILPVLTGAGILGLAIGFGAQTLVRDVLGGFFLILENQIRVGDVASINGTGGLVEAINLRTIVLRDLEGTVHVFPNGAIDTLSNRSKDFSFSVLDIGVAYKEDIDHVLDVMQQVAAELQEDPVFTTKILEPMQVLGVEAFQDSQVVLRVRFKTVPLGQWDVAREFRRRIKKAFDAHGIEIPFPHVSVYFGSASRPWQIRQAAADVVTER